MSPASLFLPPSPCTKSFWKDVLMQYTVPGLPFGGVGESGIGAYHGKTGFDSLSHLKYCSPLLLPSHPTHILSGLQNSHFACFPLHDINERIGPCSTRQPDSTWMCVIRHIPPINWSSSKDWTCKIYYGVKVKIFLSTYHLCSTRFTGFEDAQVEAKGKEALD